MNTDNDIRRQIDLSTTIGGPPIFGDDYIDLQTFAGVDSLGVMGYINGINLYEKANVEIPTVKSFELNDKYMTKNLPLDILSKNADSIKVIRNDVPSLRVRDDANIAKVEELNSPSGYIVDTMATAPTGCTGVDFVLYSQVQRSIDCVIDSEGSILEPGSLAYATKLPTTPPISCMLNLLTGPYSQCGSRIPDDKLKAAYDAFTEITGYKPVDLGQIFNQLNEEQKTILAFSTLYIFMPIFIIILIAIWLMVGFGWFNWIVGIFLTVSAIVIMYIFIIAYRIHIENFLNSQTDQLEKDTRNAQDNFQNSVAYWPQGLFGIACAITATGTTGWQCNESQSISEPTSEPVENDVSVARNINKRRKTSLKSKKAKKNGCGCKSNINDKSIG